MRDVRELLVEMCGAADVGSRAYSDMDLYEYLTECSEYVQEADRDEHRWYYVLQNIVKLNHEGVDYFITYESYDVKGEEADPSDCGWVLNMDAINFVYPHEVKTTIYMIHK
jgi:hypothetical protein